MDYERLSVGLKRPLIPHIYMVKYTNEFGTEGGL